MLRLTIQSQLTTTPVPVSFALVQCIGVAVWEEVGEQNSATAAVLFVEDDVMRRLKKEHLQEDGLTDVLSFPQRESAQQVVFPEVLKKKSEPLGDVVICVSQVERQAREKGYDVCVEACWVLAHGLLHLLGYDHQSVDDTREMRAIERKVLQRCVVRSDFSVDAFLATLKQHD